MLNYNQFKEVIVEQIRNYMPEKYQDLDVVVTPVKKVNRICDSLALVDKDKKGGVSPCLNLNNLYDAYKKVGDCDVDTMLQTVAEGMEEAFRDADKMIVPHDWTDVEDKIVFSLINTAKNEDLLRDVPHRQFLDLSIIYSYVISVDANDIYSAVITNKLAEQKGIDEETLYRCAAENTRCILPPTVNTMQEVMRDLMVAEGMPEEIADAMVAETLDNKMWIVTNKFRISGAATIMYEYVLHDLAERLDEDLYVLPSSMHEVIAIPASIGEVSELSNMVCEINATQVSPKDRLSDSVYRYDRAARKLDIAVPGNVNLDACKGIIRTPDAE